MTNSVDPDQTAPIGAVCSGSTLFASILDSSVMLSNYCSRRLQQTTFSDAFFSWRFKVNTDNCHRRALPSKHIKGATIGPPA